jgi:hypothetical protein
MSIRRWAPVVLCALALALSVRVFAQTTPILSSNITSAGKPYGCDTWEDGAEGTWYTLTRVAGGSPSGNDSLRMTWIRTNDLGNQQWGCRFAASLEAAPAQGSTRYVRWRLKYTAPMNWRSDTNALNEYEANNRTAPDKFFILGNNSNGCGGVSTHRVITHQFAEFPDRNIPLLKTQQGTRSPGNFYTAATNTWLSIQVKITSSSDTSTSDAVIRTYVNDDNEASPTHTQSGELITTAGWGTSGCAGSHIVWGDGSANPLSDDVADTAAELEMADFEYDDAFDPNWYGAVATPANAGRPTFRFRSRSPGDDD